MHLENIFYYGDIHDGAIEVPFTLDKGTIEAGYFFGDDKPKNIIVISTQSGCPSRCRFCELGDMPFYRNLSADEIREQVDTMLSIAGEYRIPQKPHKVNLAKSGEPLWNPHIVEGMRSISELGFSFKFSTLQPKGTMKRLRDVADYSASYEYNVQLQVSLISTDEGYRQHMTGIRTATFDEIREATGYWHHRNPERKVNLSLILSEDTPADPRSIVDIFPPDMYRVRFRPCVETINSKKNSLKKISDEKLEHIVEDFASCGYDKGYWATPTPMEVQNGLSSNVTLRRYLGYG